MKIANKIEEVNLRKKEKIMVDALLLSLIMSGVILTVTALVMIVLMIL